MLGETTMIILYNLFFAGAQLNCAATHGGITYIGVSVKHKPN